MPDLKSAAGAHFRSPFPCRLPKNELLFPDLGWMDVSELPITSSVLVAGVLATGVLSAGVLATGTLAFISGSNAYF
jgi:hypothetical protein